MKDFTVSLMGVFLWDRRKYSAEEKLKIAEDCLKGKDNPNHIARTRGIAKKTVRSWIAKHKAEGSIAFLSAETNRRYSSELKQKVAEEYLNGKPRHPDADGSAGEETRRLTKQEHPRGMLLHKNLMIIYCPLDGEYTIFRRPAL